MQQMILVNGSGQIGMLLKVDGIATPDAPATVTIKGGSRFVFVNEEPPQVFNVLGDAEANKNGQAFLAIDPPLLKARADNAALWFIRD